MTDSIQSSQSPYPPPPAESPQEAQRLFEIQFETSVLSIFVSVSGQNGSVKRQLSQLKNGLQTGQPTGQLATGLNQLVTQINATMTPGQPSFPPFQFTNEGSQAQALTNLATSLQTCLQTLASKQKMSNEDPLFDELAKTISGINQSTPQQVFSKLNGIIDDANDSLPPQFQIPPLAQA